MGQELIVGGARLRVVKRIKRCPATEVNPETAQRDAESRGRAAATYGHIDLGIYAEVTEGGQIAVGDAMEMLPS